MNDLNFAFSPVTVYAEEKKVEEEDDELEEVKDEV